MAFCEHGEPWKRSGSAERFGSAKLQKHIQIAFSCMRFMNLMPSNLEVPRFEDRPDRKTLKDCFSVLAFCRALICAQTFSQDTLLNRLFRLKGLGPRLLGRIVGRLMQCNIGSLPMKGSARGSQQGDL